MTQFFGGGVDLDRGGRVANVTFISDADTGKKQDINLILNTFTGDDHLRGYDLDTLTGDYIGDAIYDKPQRSINADEADPNGPFSGFIQGAPGGPDGTLVFMGRGESAGPQLSLFDPNRRSSWMCSPTWARRPKGRRRLTTSRWTRGTSSRFRETTTCCWAPSRPT